MATRWGILGCGKISHDFVCCVQALDKQDHQIVAVAARQLERASSFASDHNIPKSYGSYEELIENPDVDVVYVGVINTQHFELVKQLLGHEKHVLCEKPMGLNAKETQQMVALARANKLFLMEAVWSRCFPTYERLREEINSGQLGQVVQVNVTFCRKIDQVDRVNKKEMGGGVTLDIGIYTLQLASMVFGGQKPKQIVSAGDLNSEGVDIAVSTTLVYNDGQLACLNFSGKADATSEAVIIGTKGEAKLSDPFWAPTTLYLPNGRVFNIKLPQGSTKPFFHTNSEGLTYEAQEVRKCLKQGLLESTVMKLDESIMLAQMMDEIKKQIGVQQ